VCPEMVGLFQTVSDGSETITPEHLKACLHDVRIATLFEAQGIEITDINSFMDLLVDFEGTRELHIESFVSSCLSLKGYARSIDLLSVKHRLRLMERLLKQHFQAEKYSEIN